MRVWGGIGAILLLGLAGFGCGRDATAEAPSQLAIPQANGTAEPEGRQDASPAQAELRREGLLIGEYRLAKKPVVDGDTIKVEGIDGSIRLLSIDTEEKLRSKADRAGAARDLEQYLRRKRGGNVRPQKAGTPMGEEASSFAKAFFDGVEVVRLERDDPKEIRGRYGRMLAYAFAKKNGKWTSYNVECVRAGMSPYFTKYGYSHRFHNQFVRAESEARRAKRGIWGPDAKGYGDYAERKAWWDARAEFIRAFEHEATGRSDHVILTHWDAPERLQESLDRQIVVLAVIRKIQHFKTLVRVVLTGQRGDDLPIIFFDRDVFRRSGIERFKGEPVTVHGIVSRYERGKYSTLQVVIEKPGQVVLPALPWPDDAARAAE